MVKAFVEIHLKKGVADPEGSNTLKALKLLGFENATDVKSAKLFEIDLKEENRAKAKALLEEMCNRLLANPVIHDYQIRFE
ncbi:MAG: phosphoribosylformylglycinamidine synthase subunit PurS [Thermoplasmata archaeon]|nr:phosphoribosylformylglycinamidine synthase subunit PurS [Candidatus Thermoplasmatota archaeon]MCK4950024.1 phosphoribosylformylglycinamidine synthase subunit PurS [Thermoplasmata archaeon]